MDQNRKNDASLLGLGAAMKAAREAAGVSVRQMEMQANIARISVNAIEAGRKACSTRTLLAYCDVIGLDLVSLFRGLPKSDELKEPKPPGRPPKPLAPLPALTWDTMHEGGNQRWLRVREFIGKGGYNWARETSPGWLVTHVFFWGDYTWYIINDTEWIVKQGQGVDHEDCMRQIDAARREVIG